VSGVATSVSMVDVSLYQQIAETGELGVDDGR
jgi:hypothetical protein